MVESVAEKSVVTDIIDAESTAATTEARSE